MQETKLTLTRADALEFANYLASHPQTEPLPLAALYELADRERQRVPDPQFFKGVVNGMLLQTVITVFVLLVAYGHQLSMWIDSWRW